jgi:hypothetical protein
VVHVILDTWEGELGRIEVPDQPGQNTPHQWKKAGCKSAHLSFQLLWEVAGLCELQGSQPRPAWANTKALAPKQPELKGP